MINKCLIASIIVGTSYVLGQTTIPENFSGLYAGLGVSVTYQRTNLTQDSALLTYAIPDGPAGYFPLRNIYWAATSLDLTSISSIRPAGSIEIGYGKPINDKFYFGAAITLDLSSTKSTRKAFTGVFDDIQLRARGNSLFIGLRLGYYLPCINSLAVFRVGGSYVGSDALLEERNTDLSFHAKLHNFTPSIGLEIEKPLAKKTKQRTTLIPKSVQLEIGNPKINKIFEELKKIPVRKYPNASSVMLRVFLELSVDVYLEKNNMVNNGALTACASKEDLQGKVKRVINRLEQKKEINADLSKGIRTEIKDKSSVLSIESLNAYVHSEFFHPKVDNLLIGWDNIEQFFVKLWESINKKG